MSTTVTPNSIEVYLLDYGDFDDLVNEHFPDEDEYSFVADQETSNDTDHLFTDIQYPPKYEWKKRDVDRFIEGDRDWVSPSTMLTALVKKEVLPPGNYLIQVSW